jgi:hypothetical protein
MDDSTNEAPSRKLTLLDALILVVATAVGLAAIRGAIPGVLHVLPTSPRVRFLVPRPALDVLLIILAAWPLPAMWTLALLVMRLRSPRPAWRALARQPGVTSCCGVAMASLFNALRIGVLSLKVGFIGDLLPITAPLVGLTVIVSWATLQLGGRWRPEPCLFDRSGRVFGTYWIAMVPLSLAVFLSLLR